MKSGSAMSGHPNRTTIEVDELRSMLERHEPVMVLDVRKDDDRAEWAIPGSRHLDAYEALKAGRPDALAELHVPEGTPVVTVCGAGKVSLIAMEQLRARGYDARSLAGGMKAWSLAWNAAQVPLANSAATVIQLRRTGKGCLSYLIGDAGEAAVIDAALDPAVYQDLAAQHGWRIAHVLDTHVHADHVSRSRQLAERANATLHLPETDRARYSFSPLHDGDVIRIGGARLQAIRTPGHTLEATSFLLDETALFTGDTLFLTGVGRPDLDANPAQARERARKLHDSLRRLCTLSADTLVLPGHMSYPAAFDAVPIMASLGDVIVHVPMLALSPDAFVDAILARIPPTPPNHAAIVALNEAGELPPGDPTDLEAGANRCAVS
jgi:glyoxylase-like metal-dependent hydrolase (beta-lactamase superfamily II)